VPDQGTTVTIKLPLAQGARTDREVDAEETRASARDAPTLPEIQLDGLMISEQRKEH